VQRKNKLVCHCILSGYVVSMFVTAAVSAGLLETGQTPESEMHTKIM
jgi:hypothetical protein